MASSPNGAVNDNDVDSSDSEESDIAEENENIAEVEARIATLLTQVY